MAGHRITRERRWPVLAAATVRFGAGWVEARIHSVSAHGLMIACNPQPVRGHVVEIRARGINAVGRVVWKKGRYCGLRLQDRIDVVPVLGLAAAADSPVADRLEKAEAAGARRVESTVRHVARARLALVAAALVAASFGVTHAAVRLFGAPLADVGSALTPP